ncbi:hypothetical protein H8E88_08560 [candidate division KSB1 bacterium]|nr:hypothetical protein [candidate division KSB1 bacterium]
MRVEDIPAYEQNFDATGIDSAGKKHNFTQRQIQIPGESTILNYVLTQPASGIGHIFILNKLTKIK